MITMLDGFPERLRTIRKSKNLTQTQLGETVGINKDLISHYENGIHSPSIVTLEWLCKALNVSASELLGF